MIYDEETQDEVICVVAGIAAVFDGTAGCFAALALLLACVGIYGVISYVVGQRTHEIGVRIALGARRRDVLRVILGQGARLVLMGIAIGIVGAIGLTRLMASQLFQISTTDPLTFAAVAADARAGGVGGLLHSGPARGKSRSHGGFAVRVKIMETLLQDLRYGFRMLWKSPGFTAVAVVTLALGIGANTAMFSVINSVLFNSVPFHDASRVMVVWKTMSNGSPNAFSTPAFLEIRQQGDGMGHLGAFSNVGKNLGGTDVPERIIGGKANVDLLPVFGVQPILGRMFSAEEDHPGAGNVVILGHALWSTRFGARRDILGQAVTLDGAPYTVIGVMPPNFHVLSTKELFWIPLQLESANAQASARNVHWLFAFTRLGSGTSQQQTQAGLDAIAARLKTQDPNGEGGFGATLQPMADFVMEM